MTRHEVTHNTREFVTAGKAIFTIVGATSRFTFKVNRKDADPDNPRSRTMFFVGVMTGSDNERSYSYLGVLDPATGNVRLTRKSRFGDGSTEVRAIRWALRHIWTTGSLPEPAKFYHEGKCAHCGRTLTVPESIELGFGPDCAAKLGITRPDPDTDPDDEPATVPAVAAGSLVELAKTLSSMETTRELCHNAINGRSM